MIGTLDGRQFAGVLEEDSTAAMPTNIIERPDLPIAAPNCNCAFISDFSKHETTRFGEILGSSQIEPALMEDAFHFFFVNVVIVKIFAGEAGGLS